jgi:hypothetical protein
VTRRRRACRRAHQSLALAIAGLACAAPHASRAGVWTLEPSLAASTEYATNPLLRPDQPESGYALVANVGLPAQWDDGARHAEITPRIRAARASGDSPIGASAFYLSAAADLPTERSDLSTSLRFGNDSSAIREPAAGTLIRTDLRQSVLDAEAAWTDALSERLQSRLAAAFQSLNYLDRATALAAGLYSYRYGTVSGQLLRPLTERTKLELVGQGSRYEANAAPGQQSTYSLQAGLAGTATALWNYQLRVGRSLTEDSVSGQRSYGSVYLARLERAGERSTGSASLTKSIQPSGFGVLAQSTEAAVSWRWAATERLSGFVTARRSQESSFARGSTLVQRDYESMAAGLALLASETWTLTAQLSWQQISTGATAFESAQSGHGYGALISAERRFGRVRLT